MTFGTPTLLSLATTSTVNGYGYTGGAWCRESNTSCGRTRPAEAARSRTRLTPAIFVKNYMDHGSSAGSCAVGRPTYRGQDTVSPAQYVRARGISRAGIDGTHKSSSLGPDSRSVRPAVDSFIESYYRLKAAQEKQAHATMRLKTIGSSTTMIGMTSHSFGSHHRSCSDTGTAFSESMKRHPTFQGKNGSRMLPCYLIIDCAYTDFQIR
jgi:hypothetical protein